VIAEGRDAKSIGAEHTYGADTADLERLRSTLLDLADGVARRLRKAGLKARTLTLKYRDESFRTVTRASTLPAPTDEGAAIFASRSACFEGVHGRLRVRLLGVSASGLEEPPQLDLFPKPPSKADRFARPRLGPLRPRRPHASEPARPARAPAPEAEDD